MNPDLNVVVVPVVDLVPDPENARKHSARNLEAIAGSLRLFGQRRPLVVHGQVVIAGNGTLEAAKSLGWTHVAITRTPTDWSVEQARAYALADNRTAELATWDEKILADQLVELDAVGWDVAEIGFEQLVPPTDPDAAEDELPELPSNPRTCLGDVWQIGPHRIACGDSLDTSARTRLLGSRPIDAVITDPPYGIGAGTWQRLGMGKINREVGEWDDQRPTVAWLLDLAPKIAIWGGNYFTDELPPTNDWLCWHKKNDGRTFSEFELAWTNFGKQARHISHHWSGEEKLHITMKPLAVMIWCLEFLPLEANVFDPFTGSGSTLLAAARTNRVAYGIELNPAYVDVAVQRLEQELGEEARLDEG